VSEAGEHATSRLPPMVSVIVPAYNAAAWLPRTLASLAAQEYPTSRYEVILVDDGSLDATSEVARRFAASWPGTMRVLKKANGGPGSARNWGVADSHSEMVAFLDADCAATPDWLRSLVTPLAESDAAGIGGPIIGASPMGWVATYLDATGFYRQRVRHGQVDYLLTGNAAFRRAALQAVGGFKEHAWAEDADLSFRLRAAGYSLLVTEHGRVVHYGAPSTVRALARELYRYGCGSYWQSQHWPQGRQPAIELVRHAGAIVLSLGLALRLIPRVGWWTALRCWPLVMVEHGAFCCGILTARWGHTRPLQATLARVSDGTAG
jgi:cellulose synthase/poly-beta-1,6-N-acetylglucosamine synthase-like glycosyltransferase